MTVFKRKILFLAIFMLITVVNSQKKDDLEKAQSRYKQVKDEKSREEFKLLKRPFRIAKLNYVWDKAVHHLSEPKLQSLFLDLKLQDKEELAYKMLKEADKSNVKETELRHKLIGIMSTYDLLDFYEDTNDKDKTKHYKKFHDPEERHLNKSLFKDKKLSALWEKAEISGFTKEELQALKEEFLHHQDKVDAYYNLLDHVGTPNFNRHENAINEEEIDDFNLILNNPNDNHIETQEEKLKKYESNINNLRDHHRGIKDHYDRLERLVASGPDSQDFIEPKVQGLWRVAVASNFTDKELDSIKSELHHFETRLLKLRHLHVEHAVQKEKYKNDKHKDKSNRFDDMESHIKKQERKVEKLQETIEKTIFKHTEL